MAYVLVKTPIDMEELARRIYELLQQYDRGVHSDSIIDYLFEDSREGEGGVCCEQEECDEALNILRERSLIEEVDDESSRGGKVLRAVNLLDKGTSSRELPV